MCKISKKVEQNFVGKYFHSNGIRTAQILCMCSYTFMYNMFGDNPVDIKSD